MRDVSHDLLPDDGSVLDGDQHARFLDHIAGLCAATWDFHDDAENRLGLVAYPTRWSWFGTAAVDVGKAHLGWPEHVHRIARDGWERFAVRAPADVADLVGDTFRDVSPLADALATPSCLIHGDVKASNTGVGEDGRTVLIDWAYVGEGPACHELVWHLALDRARLPITKDATTAAFRSALERHGIDTTKWWDRQLALCLLGGVVQFGWEKALGDDDELDWWCDVARAGAAWL